MSQKVISVTNRNFKSVQGVFLGCLFGIKKIATPPPLECPQKYPGYIIWGNPKRKYPLTPSPGSSSKGLALTPCMLLRTGLCLDKGFAFSCISGFDFSFAAFFLSVGPPCSVDALCRALTPAEEDCEVVPGPQFQPRGTVSHQKPRNSLQQHQAYLRG